VNSAMVSPEHVAGDPGLQVFDQGLEANSEFSIPSSQFIENEVCSTWARCVSHTIYRCRSTDYE
jgi:hypothetical protein